MKSIILTPMKNIISIVAIVLIIILYSNISQAQTVKPVKLAYSFKAPKLVLNKLTSECFYHYSQSGIRIQSMGRDTVINAGTIAIVKSKMAKQPWMLAALDNSTLIRNNDVADLIFVLLNSHAPVK